VFVNANLSRTSDVLDSAAITHIVSVGVATPLAIVIVAVAGVNPSIPCASGSAFHSFVPTGDEPSSGYDEAFTCVACL